MNRESRSSCTGVRIIAKVANLNAKRSSLRKYRKGLGNLCSSAVYINFQDHFVRLTIKGG